jgi:hypothetical protein
MDAMSTAYYSLDEMIENGWDAEDPRQLEQILTVESSF